MQSDATYNSKMLMRAGIQRTRRVTRLSISRPWDGRLSLVRESTCKAMARSSTSSIRSVAARNIRNVAGMSQS